MGRRLRSLAPDSGHYGVAFDRDTEWAAVMATLIMTVKLNDVDPLAWLADVLAHIASLPQGLLHELLPWNWSAHVWTVAPHRAA